MEHIGIGAVSERTGLSVHTIRLYEAEGFFLGPIERDSLGRRLYHPDDVDWLEKVALMREVDMPIAQIAAYARLAREGAPDADRLALLLAHRRRLQETLERAASQIAIVDQKVRDYQTRISQGEIGPPWREAVRQD